MTVGNVRIALRELRSAPLRTSLTLLAVLIGTAAVILLVGMVAATHSVVRLALDGLMAHRLRSLLTMMGVVIGTSAVILLVAIGAGSAAAVVDQIAWLGTDTVYVMPIDQDGDEGRAGTRSRPAWLTAKDVRALQNRSEAPDVAAVAPGVDRPVTATWNGTSTPVPSFLAIGPVYHTIARQTLAAGRYFDEAEAAAHARVAVIGQTTVGRLFGNDVDPVGQTIQIDGVRFRVVGVLNRQHGLSQDRDDTIIVPLNAALDHVVGPVDSYGFIAVRAVSGERAAAAEAQVEAILRRTHRIGPGDPDDFATFNAADLIATQRSTTEGFTRLLTAVAGITLLVGGIGLMNIMLVNVAQRTPEIGLRKAIGARPGQIVGQFLSEAVALSVLGGVIGMAVGVAAAQRRFGSLDPVLSAGTVALAFGSSVLIGVVFGAYPARRAARLSPCEAFRHQ